MSAYGVLPHPLRWKTCTALIIAVAVALITPPPASAAVEVAWTRQFGTAARDVARGVTATDKAIYVAGFTEGVFDGQSSSGLSDSVVRKYSPGGTVAWTRQFGTPQHDSATAVAVRSSLVHVAGTVDGALPGNVYAGTTDAYVRTYDSSGAPLWTEQFGTSGYDVAAAVSATADGVFVMGLTSGTLHGQISSGGEDAYIRQLDATSGNSGWTRQFGTSSNDEVYGGSASSSGVYIAGRTPGAFPGQTSSGGVDAWVRRFRADGTVAWTRQFGSSLADSIYGVVATTVGAYVAGATYGALPGHASAGAADAFLRRYDSAGRLVWSRQFGTPSNDFAFAVTATSAGAYVFGYTGGAFSGQTSAGAEDVFVRKYSPSGALLWTRQLGTAASEIAQGAAATTSGVYVTGPTKGTFPGQTSLGDDDVFLVRIVSYRPDGLIRGPNSTTYVGGGVYNTTGSGQTRSAGAKRGQSRTFALRAQNDGDATDALRVKGCASSSGFRVRYLAGLRGTTDITSAVTGGTYALTSIPPAGQKSLRAVITPTSRAALGAVRSCKIVLTSAKQPVTKDAVRAQVRVTS